MKQTVNFIGADVGASNGRLLLATFDGNRFDLDVLHRFPNSVVLAGGRYQWDILRIWNEMLAGLTSYVHKHGANLAGIGIDTWGVDYGLLDRAGHLIGNPVGYRDPRTEGVVARATQLVPRAEMFALVGSHFIQFNTLFQLFVMREQNDPQLDIAETLLFTPDLLNYWLTGRKAAEYTIASTSMLLHAGERRWATELMNRLNVPTHILPPLVQPGEVLGTILPAVAEITGLNPATRVLTVGSHDTASAVAAVPGMDGDSIFISSGTWALTGAEIPQPILSAEALRLGFTNEGGVGGTIRFLQNFTGLWLLQSCQAQWKREGTDYTWDRLVQEAAQATPFACIVDPDAHDFFAPGNMIEAFRAYAALTKQQPPQTVGAAVRCCLESIALNTRWGVEAIEQATDRGAATAKGAYNTIRLVGGGCQNQLLNQWIADATGRLVVSGPVEATALGNVMMQAIATGHLGSIAEGRAAIGASIPQQHFEPRPSAQWDDAFARFATLKTA